MNKKVKQKKSLINLTYPDYKEVAKLTKLVTNIIKSIYYFNILTKKCQNKSKINKQF